MTMNSLAFSAVIVAAFATQSSAATFSFSSANNIQAPFIEYVDGGLTMTVTGHNYTPTTTVGEAVTLGDQVDVNIQQVNGLGVCNGLTVGDTIGDCGQPQIDAIENLGGPEMAKFSFSSAVTITSVTFNQNDVNDDVDIFSGTPFAFVLRDTDSLGGGPNSDEIDLTGIAAFQDITMFGVGIFDNGRNGNNSDQLRIASITYEIAAVPLPASALMLIGAVGGLGALRRRKHSA